MLIVYTMTECDICSRDNVAETLLKRMSKGEVDAMGDLYALIEKDVYAYAISKTANRVDAEEITHDTFVQIWKNSTQYKPMGKPLAWIFTIEMNLIRRQYNNNQKFVALDETTDSEASSIEFTESVINDEFLRQILAILSEEEREIISLHIVSGLKHREIAKLLNKPLSTVLSKYNRAIKKLQVQVRE